MNFRNVCAEMWRGVRQSRYLAYRLFLRDLKAEYSHAQWGWIWDLLEPLSLGIVFILLMQANVISAQGIHIPRVVFVIFGVMLWQTFNESITRPLEIVRRAKSLITNSNVSPESLLMAVILRIAFNSMFRIIIMVAIALYGGAFSPIGFIKFLALFPAIILAGLAFGVLLAPFNTIYNDIAKLVNILLRPLMYATPVLYPKATSPVLAAINSFSPVTAILVNLRLLATENILWNPTLLCIMIGSLGLLFLVGWFIFHLSIPIVAERA